MLGGVGLVGRVGQGRFMGTLFPWVTNPSLQAALNEAARTGLVLGMGAPSGEENWLRGVRQGPLATGVTGATYARSGTRAGLDPANSFGPNVVRREAGRGVRVFGAGTNEMRSSAAPSTQSVTVSATAHTLSFFGTGSVTLSGVATGTLNGTGANNRVSLTFTPTAGSLTLTVSGSVTLAQLEQSAFATDYIPNASTVASASAGADDLVVGTGADVTLGSDHAFIIEGTVPNLVSGTFPNLLGWNASSASIGINVDGGTARVGINAGAASINLQGGPTLTAGQTVRALFRVSGGNTGRLFVNGVAAFANTAFTPSTGLASFFMGQTPSKTNLLGSGLGITAVLLRAPSDAECLAITAL